MNNLVLSLVVAAALATRALAATPIKPVTVGQLMQLLSQSRGEKDAKVARQLSTLVLTQRISPARLEQWYAQFPGDRTRQALTELADASAFLDLPASEILSQAAPDGNALVLMLRRSVNYVNQTTHRLPDFYAARTTTHFEDALAQWADHQLFCKIPAYQSMCRSQVRAASAAQALGGTPLTYSGKSKTTVTFREGKEVLSTEKKKAASPSNPDAGLVTSGEFGPILIVVLGDALQGEITWGHWEQDDAGTLAVLEYNVPEAISHYVVGFPTAHGHQETNPAYHGEIAIDPVTGAIHRITVVSKVDPPNPTVRTAMMVQYGPVAIGGRTYICPVKGVAISKMPIPSSSPAGPSFVQTRLNDINFTRYHLFRAQVKILSDRGPVAEAAAPQNSR